MPYLMIRVTQDQKKRYLDFCSDMGINMSRMVRRLLEIAMNERAKIKTSKVFLDE